MKSLIIGIQRVIDGINRQLKDLNLYVSPIEEKYDMDVYILEGQRDIYEEMLECVKQIDDQNELKMAKKDLEINELKQKLILCKIRINSNYGW